MKITLLPDGSLQLSEPLNFPLGAYYQDPKDPLHFIPKFPPCKFKVNGCHMSACGKRAIIEWTCSLKQIFITPAICGACHERKEPEEGST